MSSTMPMKPSKSVSITYGICTPTAAPIVSASRRGPPKVCDALTLSTPWPGIGSAVSRGRSSIVAWCSAGFTPMRWIASPRVTVWPVRPSLPMARRKTGLSGLGV